ncbi:hypothetical protein [Flavobacterium sp.]|jgi:hypothetical protein|uniref:immunoglobulin domain-containing protein n=1 Tax=Flavobacterium sp. TaxID=239 RepID=UPI0037BFF559
MKNISLFLVLLLSVLCNGQDFQWARQVEGVEDERCDAIEVDDNGNSYIIGTSSTLLFDIDPTNGQQIIDNTANNGGSSSQTLYLIKLDSNGNFVWGKTFNSFSYYDKAIDIKIGTDGNLYLLAMTGAFDSTTTIYANYITIIKLDQNGTILFTKQYGNLNNPLYYQNHSATSFDLDNQNNIYISGYFAFHLQLHPTDPLFNLDSGYKDSFLIKLDSSGNLSYAKKLNVNYTNDHLERVNVAPDGNLNLLLSNGDNQSLSSYGYHIIKINSSDGNEIWRKYLENQIPTELGTDNFGNIVIAGQARNSYGPQIDVDPSTTTYLIPPKKYLLWLDGNGNFLDAKSYTSTGIGPTMFFTKITFDSDNNTYVGGNFYFQFDADPSSNITMLVNTTLTYCSDIYHSIFSIKFDNNRNFLTAFKYGQYSTYCPNLYVNDIKIKNGYQYYVGNFGHAYIDLDPSVNDYTFHVSPTNTPYGDGYILKLGPCDSLLPNASGNQSFCSSQNPTVSSLSPNSSSFRWYSSLTSTIQLLQTTPLINGQTYYVSKQIGSCPESARLPVTVTINQSPLPPITNNQIFCESDNATISTLIANGLNIKWYASLTDTTELPSNHLLTSVNYYATQTINNCESDRIAINVTVNSNSLPTVTSPQKFCIQQNATLNDIIISGSNIKWYNASTGGNLLPNSTILLNSTTYYASQTINGCESSRVPVLVNIQNTPTPTGPSLQTFCSTQNPTLIDLTINGTNVIWYNSNTGTIPLSGTTNLINGGIYYASQTINSCESVNRLPITVSLINTLNANNYSEVICDNLNDGNEILDLATYNSLLISNTSNCTFEYYNSLSGATNQSTINLITATNNYNLITGNHIIYVRINSNNGCHQIVELTLTLVNKPIVLIADITPICTGNNITISAGLGFDTYNWSTGEISQSIVINQEGNYSVTVTKNNFGTICSTTKILKSYFQTSQLYPTLKQLIGQIMKIS